MKKIACTLIILMICATIKAQTDPQYRMEIGAAAGLGNYLGDYNGSIIKGMQPSGSIIARRILNPYMAIRANATYLNVKGNEKSVETYYPSKTEEPYSFSNMLIDVGFTFEYNFWPYGTGKDYRGAKRLTPFIFGGVGGTYANPESKNVFTANLPIGLGVKYKLNTRLNISLDWSIHFSLSDELDGSKDPYTIESKGLFKNTDSYSILQLSITYSFMEKCRTCHNDDY